MSVPGVSELPDLCVINYNGSRYLPESLGHVRELRAQFGRVVFVDDASTDDSMAVARKALSDACFVALPRNRGPGPARNAGMAELGARRVLFMDNDVFLNHETVAELSRALDEAPAAVAAVPRVVAADNPDRIEYDGGDAHYSGLVSLRSAGESAGTADRSTTPVGSLITCCFLLDRTRWGSELLFDEAFGMYGDDHELGLRARILGHDLVAVPSAVCLHGKGTPGISIRETGSYTARRIQNTIVNRWQVLLKLYEGRTLVLLSPYLVTFELFQLAGCIALGWGREWAAAVRELFSLLPDLRARRSAVQRLRQRDDREALEGGPHPFNPALRRKSPVRFVLPLLDAIGAASWAVARLGYGERART
jgi:GT2 family glycosyltransferase